jgi:putative phage-type endonuclease
MDVYMEKLGLTAPLIETEVMRWGKILEEPVAREYAVKTGRKIRRAAGFIRDPAHPFLYANVDRWSDKVGTPRRVYEGKTSGMFAAKDFGEEGTDQVPPDYLIQAMHYLYVTGKDTADLAVLVGGQKHRIYTIERDDELIRDMVEQAEEFWSNTQQGIPPELDGSEGSAAYLRHQYRDVGLERRLREVPSGNKLFTPALELTGSTEGTSSSPGQPVPQNRFNIDIFHPPIIQ